MITRLLLLAAALALQLTAGCSANRAGSAASTEGANGPLVDPGNNTMNSPTTAPNSSGLSGGPIGTGPVAGASSTLPGVPTH